MGLGEGAGTGEVDGIESSLGLLSDTEAEAESEPEEISISGEG